MKSILVALFASLAAAALWAFPATARGDSLIVTDSASDRVGEYDATSGAAINASLVPGVLAAGGMALSGGDLFVTDEYNHVGAVAEYTASGATVNATFITGLHLPGAPIAVSAGDLFVGNGGNGAGSTSIGEYDATSGAIVNGSLITGIDATGFAASGGDLFVANPLNNSIGEYTTSGTTVNASLITGIAGGPWDVAVSGSDLFVVNQGAGTVGEYTTSGVAINASLITGLDDPSSITVSGSDLFIGSVNPLPNDGDLIGEYTTSGATVNASLVPGFLGPIGAIVVVSTPEPSTWAMLAIGAMSLLANGLRKPRRHA